MSEFVETHQDMLTRLKMGRVYYTFQCNRCFIISGYMSYDPNDAPNCCGGELMSPISHTCTVRAAKEFLEEG